MENLKQHKSTWAAVIETMQSWLAYPVVFRQMNIVWKGKSEQGTGMFFTYMVEALTLCMTTRDISFEIDKQLVKTDVHLLSLQ